MAKARPSLYIVYGATPNIRLKLRIQKVAFYVSLYSL